jgi:hypothetical protein
MTDYGYDNPEYGYGDTSPDCGYSDTGPDMDYGYGDDAAPENTDYGYGAEVTPEAAKPTESRRPKRRCSVTKYSLVSSEGSAEAEMGQQIQQAEMLQSFRNGGGARPLPPQPTSSEYSTASTESFQTDDDETTSPETAAPKKGKSKLSKLRRRLSVF